MSFKLIQYTVECSERGDSSKTIAISNSREAIVNHVEKTLGKSLTRDNQKPFDDYYEIHPSKILIVDEIQKDIQGSEEEHY